MRTLQISRGERFSEEKPAYERGKEAANCGSRLVSQNADPARAPQHVIPAQAGNQKTIESPGTGPAN